MISHEGRTPMNGIIGMTNMLLATPLSRRQREYATNVRESADGLLTIINDILDFSRIEGGKLLLDVADFDLRAVCKGTMALFKLKVREKKIDLRLEIAPEVETMVRGDAQRLRQVLLNLVGNAVKFTERGEVVLHVTLEQATEAQMQLRFAVSDTGIGLSRVARERLFQPFTQADGSTTRKYGGTGLGLAISKRLVEFMGGEIGVDSVEGQGSTFWFRVSLERSKALPDTVLSSVRKPRRRRAMTIHRGRTSPAISGASASSSALPHTLPTPSVPTILVAEDNPVNREVALFQLRKLGYCAEAVANGREAVAAVQACSYALVLMDCQMPELDGLAATGQIREAEVVRAAQVRLPIIAMTANAMRGDRDACLRAGMDDYISKPVHINALRDALERWMPKETVSQPVVLPQDTIATTADLPLLLPAPLDLEVLESLRALQVDGAPELIGELVDLFCDGMVQIVATLHAAICDGDAVTLSRAAHRGKGSSANLGANHLAYLCKRLEELARAGEDLAQAPFIVEQLQTEYERVRMALARERENIAV